MSERVHELEGLGYTKVVGLIFAGDQIDILPDGDLVGAPTAAQRPTRQRLAWIPFALPEVKQRARRYPLAEAADESQAAGSLHRPQSIDVPLRAVRLVDADERRFAAHRQAHILRLKVRIDAMRHLFHLEPIFFGERFGRPRGIIQAANRDGIVEVHVGRFNRALNGRSLGSVGGADEWDVTLAREQARGRIHSDPTRTRQKYFRPGMEIGRVGLRTARGVRLHLVRRFLVRCQLNQIAGDEACGDSQMPENLHQEPCRVTAGSRALSKGLLACLDARIQARDVANFVSHSAIHVDQKADRSLFLAEKFPKEGFEQRSGGIGRKIRFEILSQLRSVIERVVCGSWFENKVERIEGR